MTSLFPNIPSECHNLLWYPGGKFNGVRMIRRHFPADLKLLVSPFFGGGSVELSCAGEGIQVLAYDAFEPLINFWQYAKSDLDLVADRVQSYYPVNRETYYEMKATFDDIVDPVERAAVFFVVNRASFSGMTLAQCGYSSKGFMQTNIDRLRNFTGANLEFKCQTWQDTLADHPDEFMYLDPPYMIEANLYGRDGELHRNFDHVELATALRKRDNWILSYNNIDEVRELYDGYDYAYPDWATGLASGYKPSNEILILNI